MLDLKKGRAPYLTLGASFYCRKTDLEQDTENRWSDASGCAMWFRHPRFPIYRLNHYNYIALNGILKITEPTGRVWEVVLAPGQTYTIGRARENDIVLNDRRVSRRHAFITSDDGGGFKMVDGSVEGGQLARSVNHVFVNGSPQLEAVLADGDLVVIGESKLIFGVAAEQPAIPATDPKVQLGVVSERGGADAEVSQEVKYDDAPLGHTQVQISVNEIIGRRSDLSIESAVATPEEIKDLGERQRSSSCFLR